MFLTCEVLWISGAQKYLLRRSISKLLLTQSVYFSSTFVLRCYIFVFFAVSFSSLLFIPYIFHRSANFHFLPPLLSRSSLSLSLSAAFSSCHISLPLSLIRSSSDAYIRICSSFFCSLPSLTLPPPSSPFSFSHFSYLYLSLYSLPYTHARAWPRTHTRIPIPIISTTCRKV